MRSPANGAPSRLYLPELPPAGGALTLVDDEARYVARVIRARAGERVEATDGRGGVAKLRLLRVERSVEAEVESRADEPRSGEAWLLCGAPEGERGDWLVEKLAEFGIARLVPVDTARARWKPGRGERWERLAVAALRQSRRAWRLEIEAAVPLGQALDRLPVGARWVADPGGPGSSGQPPEPGGCVGAVGPAEGFDEGERQVLDGLGFRRIRLAGARLRTETAALAWAAWWAAAQMP